MSVAIGIDLGTTNTVVAAVVDGVAVTLEDDQGRRLLPSVVSFHPSSTVLVGEPARERRLMDPENTVFSVKPLLGRAWDSDEVRAAKARFPFNLAPGTKNTTTVIARDVAYALPEISAFVLRRAKSIAEAALGQTVERAVITVPANFNDLQRASTKIAGKLAGLDVMRILNEPTAAALAYGQSIAKAEKIAVYDLGGGTFDITLLDLTGSVFEVLATAGDTALGGDDIDRALADRIALEVLKRFNVDPRTSPMTSARLSFIAEEVKKELSAAYQSQREITDVGFAEGGREIRMPLMINREDMEMIAKPFVDRTIAVAKQTIDYIGLRPQNFDRVILVGGSTRMPLVARSVEQLFGQPAHLKVNPDEVVALGAAIQAHALNRTKSAHKRRSAHDQLAHSQSDAVGERAPTRPPDANPNLGAPPPVPRPPPVPNLGPPRPKAPSVPSVPQNQAANPDFFTFSKAPAVISFGTNAPPPMPPQRGPSAPPPVPGGPPPVPGKPIGAMRPRQPTMPFGHTQPTNAPPPVPAKPAGKASVVRDRVGTLPFAPFDDAEPPTTPRHSQVPIEGAPVRNAVPDLPVGPKPPRASAPPPAPELGNTTAIMASMSAPELDLDLSLPFDDERALPEPAPPLNASITAPINAPLTSEAPRNFFSGLDLMVPEPTAQQFTQGSAISTSKATPLLIDVTPLSLGVETVGGYSDVLIPANSPVPCEKARTFLTASDGQTMVSIRVAQGESSRFVENTRLGDLVLSGLRSARRGEVRIVVTFELDADGILNVRARDHDTGRETAATMRLLGASTDAEDIGAMAARQARHNVA